MSFDGLACSSVMPAGCQVHNTDVADANGTRVVYCSTLALYLYDIAGQPRLERILTASDRTILSVAWNPFDPNVIAMAVAEDNHNIHLWDLEAQVVTRKISADGQAKFIVWSPLNAGELVTASLMGAVHRLNTLASNGPELEHVSWTSRAGSTGSKEAAHPHHNTPRVACFRVNPRKNRRYAMGFDSGLVHVLTDHNGRTESTMDMPHKGDAIADCQWDPLSENYLLVGCKSGNLLMYDVECKTVLQTFDPLPNPKAFGNLQALAWNPTAPGDFISVSDKTGVVRMWNVSQPKPKDSLKAEAGPFHGFTFIAGTQRALCRFKSGAVGILDLQRRTWLMFGRAAHTDTVFCAAFKPSDPNVLATCSYDGSIRVWDMKEAALLRELVSEGTAPGVLYHLAWAPHDPTRLVAVTSKCEALLWDVENSVLQKRTVLMNYEASDKRTHNIYSCGWARTQSSNIIACAGDDGIFILHADGTLALRIRTPKPTFGVSFNPHKPSLATGCGDNLVRIHSLSIPPIGSGQNATQTDTKLEGHMKRVFSVLWSPLQPDMLLSGSDDTTVRVWDVSSGMHRTLTGHTHNVRALHWSYEIPWLAFSGSWDGTIRVWDTRSCTAVQVIIDHTADVYCIVSHPQRPGVMLSVSRDTTIRTWALDTLFTPIMLPLLLGVTAAAHGQHVPTQQLTARLKGDCASELSSRAMLPQACCGSGSRELADRLVQAAAANVPRLELLALIFDFFYPPRGMANLWSLLGLLDGSGGGRAEVGAHEVRSGDAVLESTRGQLSLLMADKDSSKSKMVGEGSNRRRVKQDDRLRMAATMSLHLGEMEQYCELMIMLGEWTHAIGIAPSVSVSYWRSLCARHAAILADSSTESVTVTPFMIGAGDHHGAVQYMLSRHEYLDAQTLASAGAHGFLPGRADEAAAAHGMPAVSTGGEADSSLVVNVLQARANAYSDGGEPVLAACCSLAREQASGAMAELLRSHQLELAFAVALALNLPALPSILHMLSARAERLNDWPLALSLLQRTRDPAVHISLLAARCAQSHALDAPVDLFAVASLPPAASYLQLAETAQRGGNTPEAVRCYVVSGDVEAAAELALPVLKRALGDGACDLNSAQAVLEPLRQASLDGDGSQGSSVAMATGWRAAVLAWSAFEATLQAMWRGYTPVLMPLRDAAAALSASASEPHAPSECDVDALSVQVYAYLVRSQASPSAAAALGGELHDKAKSGILSASLAKAMCLLQPPQEPPIVHTRPTLVSAAALPVSGRGLSTDTAFLQASGQTRSYFDGSIIQGPSFPVARGQHARNDVIPLSEAIMWAKLHPFSPVHSGQRLNPF